MRSPRFSVSLSHTHQIYLKSKSTSCENLVAFFVKRQQLVVVRIFGRHNGLISIVSVFVLPHHICYITKTHIENENCRICFVNSCFKLSAPILFIKYSGRRCNSISAGTSSERSGMSYSGNICQVKLILSFIICMKNPRGAWQCWIKSWCKRS